MTQKIKLGDKEYDVDNLSDEAKTRIKLLQYTIERIQELNNMQKLLQRAKIGYIDSIKKEMLSEKSGFLFGDE